MEEVGREGDVEAKIAALAKLLDYIGESHSRCKAVVGLGGCGIVAGLVPTVKSDDVRAAALQFFKTVMRCATPSEDETRAMCVIVADELRPKRGRLEAVLEYHFDESRGNRIDCVMDTLVKVSTRAPAALGVTSIVTAICECFVRLYDCLGEVPDTDRLTLRVASCRFCLEAIIKTSPGRKCVIDVILKILKDVPENLGLIKGLLTILHQPDDPAIGEELASDGGFGMMLKILAKHRNEHLSSLARQIRVTILRCANCGSRHNTIDGGSFLLTCGKCRASYYCSKNCQRVHWATHKHVCVAKHPGS